MQIKTTSDSHLALRWISTAGLLSLTALIALRGVACGVEEGRIEPDVETWPLRDLLSVEPEALRFDADERAALRERVVAASEEDRGVEFVARSPASLRYGDPNFPTDPLGALARFDRARMDVGEDARLFAVYGQDEQGAWSMPCAAEPGDLLDEEGRLRVLRADGGEVWPTRWQAWPAWERDRPGDMARLKALAGPLSAWARRCADSADATLHEDNIHVVQREVHAPWLVAFWPQRRKVYINPILLDLITEDAPPDADALRTAQRGLALESLQACVSDLTSICQQCATANDTANNPALCQQLFPDSTLPADCAVMRDQIAGGFELYCIYSLYQNRPSVEACVQRQVGSTCDRQNVPVSSLSTLVQVYDPFVNAATSSLCRQQASQCADPNQPSNNTSANNNPVNNSTPDPEPTACGQPGAEPCEEPGFVDDCSVCVWCQEDAGETCNSWCEPDEEDSSAQSEEDSGLCGSLCGSDEEDSSSSEDDSSCCN